MGMHSGVSAHGERSSESFVISQRKCDAIAKCIKQIVLAIALLVAYTSLCVTILLVLLGRAAAVYPLSLAVWPTRWRIAVAEQHVLFWAGLRGALGLALALSLPDSLPMRGAVVIATFGVVTFSVIVQGLTMPLLLRRATLRSAPQL